MTTYEKTAFVFDLLVAAAFAVVVPVGVMVLILSMTSPADALFICGCSSLHTAFTAMLGGLLTVYHVMATRERCGARCGRSPSMGQVVLLHTAIGYVSGLFAVARGQRSGLSLQVWQTVAFFGLPPLALVAGGLVGLVVFWVQGGRTDGGRDGELGAD